jgi:hypothetical protein
MSAETTIRNVLTSNNITWFPLIAPHDALAPFVVYQEISTNLNIRSHAGDAAIRSRWQLTAWAYDYDGAGVLADTVKGLFHLNLTDFQFSAVENKFDLPDPDSGLFRKILEVYLWDK